MISGLPKRIKDPLLSWSICGTDGLSCQKAKITFVTGLSDENIKLLRQHGAVGQVLRVSSSEIIPGRELGEIVGDSCKTIFGRVQNNKPMDLTHDRWVVFLVNKENAQAFLILEGIENKKRVIYKAQVSLDLQRANNNPMGYSYGYAYVTFLPLTKEVAEKLAIKGASKSRFITKKQAQQLLELIRKEAEDPELKYNSLTNNAFKYAVKWLSQIPYDYDQLVEKANNILELLADF